MSGVIGNIKAALQRLDGHFERIELQAPASAAALATLRDQTPGLPSQLRAFYAVTNGLRVGLRDFDRGRLFSAEEALEYYRIGFAHHQPPVCNLIPISSDGCGSSDCIVAAGSFGLGSVVFWDHEVYDKAAYFLGSTFVRYLDMWSESLVYEFLPNGDLHPDARPRELSAWPWLEAPERKHPWPHNTHWLRARDPGLSSLLASPKIDSLIAPQNA